MDPIAFLEDTDPVRSQVAIAIQRHWFRLREQLDRQLAFEIIDMLGRSMKKG